MEKTLIQPLLATLISFIIAIRAYHKKSLNFSGAFSGFFVMSLHLAANLRFGALLLVFFFSSSKLTKVGAEKKRKSEEDYKYGGQRNWVQVLCNSSIAAVLVAAIWNLVGWEDKCLDSRESSLITALGGGIIGHYCCCNGDTWSSEIGVLSESQPRLITTFKPVRKGTNGGVTRTGLLAAAAAGTVVGLTFVVFGFFTAKCSSTEIALKQLLVIPLSTLAGVVGSLIDSLLGATLQFSGFCSVRNKAFHSRHGKAYLFDKVVNVTTGDKEERPMLTGLHTVVDIFCVGCGSIVGWKYESAHEKSQKYKEGKFILERYQVIGPGGNEYMVNHEAQLGSDTDDA